MYALLDYDLKSLRVFKAIADSGGLSAAELALDMSLPMISTYLSVLEQRLGVKLCNRGRRGFELTAEGQSLYRSLDSLLLAIDVFNSEVDKIRDKISGVLNIGVIDNTLSDTRLKLPQAIRAVKDRSEEHTSELQSLMRISYAVFCLKNKKKSNKRKEYETR